MRISGSNDTPSVIALLLCASILALTGAPSRGEPPRSGILNCSVDVGPQQRRRCDEEAFRQVESGSHSTKLEDGWRLVKSRNADVADTVSVMHVVDSARSDARLAGLSLQCGKDGIEIVLIVLEPLSGSARLNVALTTREKRAEFEASVIQGGAALLLPADASKLVTSDWQNAGDLLVEIGTTPTAIHGAVPMAGLPAALGYLSQDCHAR
jgi:hypothetical protein